MNRPTAEAYQERRKMRRWIIRELTGSGKILPASDRCSGRMECLGTIRVTKGLDVLSESWICSDRNIHDVVGEP
jgi:hypothetical protein